MSAHGYSVKKDHRLSETVFIECDQFFSKKLPDLITSIASTLNTLRPTESNIQKTELICCLLDVVGTECMKEVTNITRSRHPTRAENQARDTTVTTNSSMQPSADTTKSTPSTSA
ncbi:hypothetical protein [Vombatid gammaherpesvirus 1]|uniref:Uncharacterized protein n=1 Tax=Vombatid gammaherpesvirus 1 TaxID=2052651 RepID=A0A3Q8J4C2_9GAMA|nr:hypothetical protein KM710_gp24 [Vombatid gammaherpesvirus 1]AZB49129.1 hypothetical protein [Vombatid gammaherpesvirus 1]